MTLVVANPFAAPGIGAAGKPRVRYATTTPKSINTSSAQAVDVFSRATAHNTAATYSQTARTEKPAVSPAADITTAAGRQEAGKNYDAILKELRGQYDEPEAMRRFDEIMRADGFERVEYANSCVSFALGDKDDKAGGFPHHPGALTRGPHFELMMPLGSSVKDMNIVMMSKVSGLPVDGKAQIAAESWAIYAAERPYSEAMQSYWQNRYMDSAQEQADFDVGEFMAALPDAAQRSVVAVDEDFGALVSDILQRNGIELENGSRLEFDLDCRGAVIVRGGGGVVLDDFFRSSPEFMAAFKDRMSNPPPENISPLAESFRDGDRSVQYSTARSFFFRAGEPAATVTVDYLGVAGEGYTYVKKAGDYFDPRAECVGATSGVIFPILPGEDMMGMDGESVAATNAFLARAIEEGEPTGGDISFDDVNQLRKEKTDRYWAWSDSIDWYLPGQDTPVKVARPDDQTEPEGDEATSPEREKAAPEAPGKQRATIAKETSASIQTLVESIRGQYAGIRSQSTGGLHRTR